MEDKQNIVQNNFTPQIFIKLIMHGGRRFQKFIRDLRIKYYLRIWLAISKNSLIQMMAQKKIFLLFLLGKLIRFGFFLSFIYFLVKGSGGLLQYSENQAIFFFLTFTLVDTVSQFLFREVYRFRGYLMTGDFDLVLVKPMSALFRILLGGMDPIDMVTIPPLIIAVVYVGKILDPSLLQVFYYVLLIMGGLLISMSFHIVVMAIGIITLEVDNSILIFRDISSMGRFPIDIYKEPFRGILTYIVPVGIMFTLPVKIIFGVSSPLWVLGGLLIAVISFLIANNLWRVAMKKYTSASS